MSFYLKNKIYLLELKSEKMLFDTLYLYRVISPPEPGRCFTRETLVEPS